MYKGKTILCIIPARGGSKGLPGKNIKLLCGKPLVAYSIEHARQSRLIDRIIVSTDDKKIANIAGRYGANVPFIRPKHLARDNSGTIDVLLHAINFLKKNERKIYDIIVLLHATTPLRTPSDVDNCIKLLVNKKCDSVFSVSEAHRNPYFNMVELNRRGVPHLVKKGNYKSRQEAPRVFDMNSSIYVWRTATLEKCRKTLLPESRIYIMPPERSVDIDDKIDFILAEALISKR